MGHYKFKPTGVVLSPSSVNNYYKEREQQRNLEYGGSIDSKPPNGYDSWGVYWKSF